MNTSTKRNILVMVVLLTVFTVYNYCIYTSEESTEPVKLTKQAIEGQKLWQNNNCWSCHQIYGLGGYLGPDLTNVYSKEGKGELYIKAFLNSGVKSMPKFNFSEEEKDAIVAFLQQIDNTGHYPNKNANIQLNGWVELEYKHEE